MAYSNEVTSLSFARSPSTIDIKVWEAHRYPGSTQENLVESVTVPYRDRVTFTVNTGPAAKTPPDRIGLTVHFGANTGPLFRSGYLETLPTPSPTDPNGLIDILEVPTNVTTQAQVDANLIAPPPAGFGPPPFVLPDEPSVTIGSLQATIRSSVIQVSVSGTTTQFLGIPVSFSHTIDFSLRPAASMYPDTTAIVVVEFTGPGVLSFGPGGPTAQSVIAAGFLQLLAGAIVRPLASRITAQLNEKINASALATALNLLGGTAGPLTALPPGIVLSAPVVTVGTVGGVTGIHVVPAIGCFGSLKSRLGSSGVGSGCALTALSMMLPAVAGVDLAHWRRLRDAMLAEPALAPWVTMYYGHGPEVAALLSADRRLAHMAATLLHHLQETMTVGGDLDAHRDAAVGLAGALGRHASAGLRRALDGLAEGLPSLGADLARANPIPVSQ